MKPVWAVYRMYMVDGKTSFLIFWGILLAIFALSCGLVWYFSGSVQFSGAPAVYIFAFVSGIVSVREPLYFSLGMGVRRKDIYAGSLLYNVSHAAASALLLTVFARLEILLFSWQELPISFFANQWLSGKPVPVEWLFHAGAILMLLVSGFFLASVYHRFGMMGLFGLAAISLLLGVLLSLTGGFEALERLLDGLDPAAGIASSLIITIVIHSALSYLCLRKLAVK